MKSNIIIGVLLAVLIGLLFFGEKSYNGLKQLQEDKVVAEQKIVALKDSMASQNVIVDSLVVVKNELEIVIDDLNNQIAESSTYWRKKLDSLTYLTTTQQLELFNKYTGIVQQDTLLQVESGRIANANILFVKGEKCEDELVLSESVVEERRKQVISLEGIIQAKDKLISLCDGEVKVREQQLASSENIIKQQDKQIKKERRKTKFVSILGTVIIILLAL